MHWRNNNWASQLNPIGSLGLDLIDNRRRNCTVTTDTINHVKRTTISSVCTTVVCSLRPRSTYAFWSRIEIVADQLHRLQSSFCGPNWPESLMLEPQPTAAYPYLQSIHCSSSIVCSPSICASLHASLFPQSCRYENGEVLCSPTTDSRIGPRKRCASSRAPRRG